MGHAFEISDETYGMLTSLAVARGQKPEDLLEQWLSEVRTQAPTQPWSEAAVTGEPSVYNPTSDPLAAFLGAFEATAPDVVRKHDAYVGEARTSTHDSHQPLR